MARDLRVKQFRTTQIIVSGSNVGTKPSFLIYSASAALGVDGTHHADLLTDVGTDVWMFVSGSKSARTGSLTGTGRSQAVLFGGDVVISGTLYAERQVMEVDTLYNSHLLISGGLVFGDQGAGPETGQVGLKSILLTNSGSLFVGTGSLYFATAQSGVYKEAKLETSTLSGFDAAVVDVAADSIVFIDANDSNNSKKDSIVDLITATAGVGLAATSGVLSVDLNELSAAVIATGDKLAFVDVTDNSSKLETIDDVATLLAGSGLSASSAVLAVDLNELSAAVVDVAADSIVIIDANDSNASKKESIADLTTAMAGTGLAASSGQLSVNIDGLSALGGTGLHQTADHFAFSDDGTEKKITFSNLEDAIFANVSGDATIAAGGALTIAATSVEGSMLNDNVISGQGALGSAAMAQADLLLIDDGPGTLKKVTFSNFEDSIFANVSGGVTIAAGGVATIKGLKANGSFGTPPVASGTDAVAIGNLAIASGNNSIAMGTSTTNNTDATGIHSLAIGGDDATASGQYASAIGGFANTASGNYSVVMGRSSSAAGENAIAIGKSLIATETDSIAIGNSSNNAKIALSGSVEVFSTTVFNDDVSIIGSGDLLVNSYIKHYGDTNTRIHFTTDEVKTTAGGANNVVVKTDQVFLLSDTYAGTDANFYVSGSIDSKGDTSTTKGTAVFGGDVAVSGSLFFDNNLKIFKDGNDLKFDDGNNTVKTLSQLATVPDDSEFFNGVHGGSNVSKAATTASFSIAGTQGTTYYTENVGTDVLLYVSGGLRSDTAAYGKSVTVFGGATVFSGSATYLGDTAFSTLTATTAIKTPEIQDASGFESIRIVGQKVSVGVDINSDPSAIFEVPLADNTQAAAANLTSNFNVLLQNRSVQTNAFAGIAFDVSTEVDADSIGAAIRAERDTSASTTEANHDANLTFSTNDARDAGLTERMRITHDGLVGIGMDPVHTLDVTGDINLTGEFSFDASATVVTAILDEDNMVTNSATSLATQQSIKAYVDAGVAGFATLTQEQVEDFAGAVVALGGTKTGIAVTYQDGTGDMDFVVDHDAATNFVANEHIDHSAVSIASGTGLSGGGDITTTRTLVVDAAQAGITSVLNAGLVIGRDGTDQIDFSTDNEIRFKVNNAIGVIMKTGGELEAASLDISGNADINGKVLVGGDTAASDVAAIGYTAAEGIIITGQGSTNDVTIKNDADVAVINIPTGGTAVNFVGNVSGSLLLPGGDTSASQGAALGYTAAEGIIITGQGSTSDVTIKNDADATVLDIKTGTTQVDLAGNLLVGGNIIKASDGGETITMDTADNVLIGNDLIVGGSINVPQYINHEGDPDTRINFTADTINFEAGGSSLLKLTETIVNTVVINEGGLDTDFRVESNLETHMLFVDGSTDRVGIGINSPATTLEIKGAAADETALQIKDSQSSDTIIKMYHENGTDDGVIDIYKNNAVTTKLRGNGCSYFDGGDISIGFQTTPDALLHIKQAADRFPVVKIDSEDTAFVTGQSILQINTADSTMDSNNAFILFTFDTTTTLGTIDGEVTYSTFTGCHPTKLLGGVIPERGSIMISNGNVIFRQGISNAWVESSISTSSKEKAVVGVYSKSWGKEEEDMHAYNAIGEGQVLVTDQGGDIEVGDYICSSDVSGHGMKQDDDILHNYTVAKALENISFANVEVNENGDKSILIACTYHCG